MARCISAALLSTAILLASPAHAAQEDDYLWWLPRLVEAHHDPERPRTYRLFRPPAALELELTLRNEGEATVLVDTEALTRAFSFSLAGAGAIPVAATWHAGSTSMDPDTALGVGLVAQVPPEGWIRWTVRLRPALRLVRGGYDLDVRFDGAGLGTPEGSPWRGRFQSTISLRVEVEPPRNGTEASLEHRVAARAAMQRGDARAAIAELERALRSAPGDPHLQADLGNAYLSLAQYDRAIQAYEQALPGLRGHRTPVPGLLALAYLGLGDEHRAADALRRGGMDEQRVPTEIARLRQILARTPRR